MNSHSYKFKLFSSLLVMVFLFQFSSGTAILGGNQYTNLTKGVKMIIPYSSIHEFSHIRFDLETNGSLFTFAYGSDELIKNITLTNAQEHFMNQSYQSIVVNQNLTEFKQTFDLVANHYSFAIIPEEDIEIVLNWGGFEEKSVPGFTYIGFTCLLGIMMLIIQKNQFSG